MLIITHPYLLCFPRVLINFSEFCFNTQRLSGLITDSIKLSWPWLSQRSFLLLNYFSFFFFLKKINKSCRAERIAQRLRTSMALVEDWTSVPRTHTRQLITARNQLQRESNASWLPQAPAPMWMYAHKDTQILIKSETNLLKKPS